MKIPTICRYCGGKIIKSTTRALYPKGSEPIYLCVNCNAYVGCYPDGSPMGKVANTVLRLKRQETHRIFDRFWREQGWTRSAAYRWLAQNLHLKEHETHIGMSCVDEKDAGLSKPSVRRHTKSQPSASGCDLERRSSKMSAL